MGIVNAPLDTGTVDSNVAFKYLWFNWRVLGVNPTHRRRAVYICYGIIINLIFSITLPGTMFVNLMFIEGLQLIITNLSLSISFAIASIKLLMLFFYRRRLKSVATYLRVLDKRCNKHVKDRAHIRHGILTSHRFYAFFMIYFNVMVTGFALLALKNRMPVYEAWFPRVTDSERVNYWLSFIFHIFGQTFACFQNSNSDGYPMCYLGIMIAHMRALSARLERIGTEAKYTAQDNYKELIKCIQDHKNIMGYFDCIRPVISTTLFLQFLMTGFILCLIGIKFLVFSQDTSQIVSNLSYFIGILMESFPCCYYVNLLCVESDYLRTAVYSSKWFEQNLKFRKVMIIFMQRTQKENVIYAGGLLPITLQTFLSILKFSFSMYTIMSKIDIH